MPETAPAAPDATSAPDPAAASTAPTAPAETPPWGDDFNADRAWSLIKGLRGDKEKLTGKVSEFEKAAQQRADAEKSEIQRAVERAERAEKAIADREAAEKRTAVLSKHGLSAADAAFLAGVSDDDLDARAEALAARLGVAAQAKHDAAEAIPGKPVPKLTAGHESSDAPDAFDPYALADRVHKRLI
jgi:hypothetical protein